MRLLFTLWLRVLYSYSEAKRKSTNDDTPSKVDVFQADEDMGTRAGASSNQQLIPVPFEHIYKEGIWDPNSDLKQPLDLLELDLRTPYTREEQEKMLKEVPKENIFKVNNNKRFQFFEDDIIAENKGAKGGKTATPKTNDNPEWFNFEVILKDKMSNPRPVAHRPEPAFKNRPKHHTPPTPRTTNYKNNTFFSDHLFKILQDPDDFKTNWTTCAEFAKGSGLFHPKDIVDIDWVPFYVWSLRNVYRAFVHRFSYPTKKIVIEYKKVYASHLNMTLDWEQPKLLLKGYFEMLLIADPNDRTGLFHGVPKRSLPTNPKNLKYMYLPIPKIRVKIVDPYLAIMFCDEFYTVIMATPDNEPANDQERTEESGILKFKGQGRPVARDLALEEAEKRAEIQRQLDYEEMKYIKATNVGMNMDFE